MQRNSQYKIKLFRLKNLFPLSKYYKDLRVEAGQQINDHEGKRLYLHNSFKCGLYYFMTIRFYDPTMMDIFLIDDIAELMIHF